MCKDLFIYLFIINLTFPSYMDFHPSANCGTSHPPPPRRARSFPLLQEVITKGLVKVTLDFSLFLQEVNFL